MMLIVETLAACYWPQFLAGPQYISLSHPSIQCWFSKTCVTALTWSPVRFVLLKWKYTRRRIDKVRDRASKTNVDINTCLGLSTSVEGLFQNCDFLLFHLFLAAPVSEENHDKIHSFWFEQYSNIDPDKCTSLGSPLLARSRRVQHFLTTWNVMLVENYSSWCMSGLRSIWEILQLISISLKLIRTIHLPWSVVSAVTEKVGRLVGHTFRCPLCWCLWTVTERPLTTPQDVIYFLKAMTDRFQTFIFQRVFFQRVFLWSVRLTHFWSFASLFLSGNYWISIRIPSFVRLFLLLFPLFHIAEASCAGFMWRLLVVKQQGRLQLVPHHHWYCQEKDICSKYCKNTREWQSFLERTR